ncbi:MAG TPA: TIM barrel protein [Myxococcota bacterium]|nr:TIM barrel protein [Myxococcota bacterium]
MRLGYNTNGFAHHALGDALEILAELGYRGVAVTLDHLHLSPFAGAAPHAAALRETAARCRDLDLLPVVETGARFLLDPRRKHQPTLLSRDAAARARRTDFLERAIDVAVALGAPVVSLWSGAADHGAGEEGAAAEGEAAREKGRAVGGAGAGGGGGRAGGGGGRGGAEGRDALDARLAGGLRTLCERAAGAGVVLALEPEPGMHVDDLAGFERVRALVDHSALRLTFDAGHAHLREPDGAAAAVGRAAPFLANVHLEGMSSGAHEHLVPWEGDLDLAAVVAALRAAAYAGPANLELSRHSHAAVETARRARAYFASLGL